MAGRVGKTAGGASAVAIFATVMARLVAGLIDGWSLCDPCEWSTSWFGNSDNLEVVAGFGLAAWILAFERLSRDHEVEKYVSAPGTGWTRVLWLICVFAPLLIVVLGFVARDTGAGVYAVVFGTLFSLFFTILWVPNPEKPEAKVEANPEVEVPGPPEAPATNAPTIEEPPPPLPDTSPPAEKEAGTSPGHDSANNEGHEDTPGSMTNLERQGIFALALATLATIVRVADLLIRWRRRNR